MVAYKAAVDLAPEDGKMQAELDNAKAELVGALTAATDAGDLKKAVVAYKDAVGLIPEDEVQRFKVDVAKSVLVGALKEAAKEKEGEGEKASGDRKWQEAVAAYQAAVEAYTAALDLVPDDAVMKAARRGAEALVVENRTASLTPF